MVAAPSLPLLALASLQGGIHKHAICNQPARPQTIPLEN
jgi:hypothetical protein